MPGGERELNPPSSVPVRRGKAFGCCRDLRRDLSGGRAREALEKIERLHSLIRSNFGGQRGYGSDEFRMTRGRYGFQNLYREPSHALQGP